jgi:glutamate dehydrogenase (NAD(P)+)
MMTTMTYGAKEEQLICTVADREGPTGFVVIDSLVGGRSCGGLRMLPDVDEAEMRALARSMTLKYGFLGLPQGGAKAAVRGDPEGPTEQRRELLRRFARAIAPLLLKGVYKPGSDMGTSNEDVRLVMESVGVTVPRRGESSPRSGYYTALTVFVAARQALAWQGRSFEGCKVAIEGFGKVGAPLAALLAAKGATITAVSTTRGALFNPAGLDVDSLLQLSARFGSGMVEHYEGADRIDKTLLVEMPVDMLCPCARHNSVHGGNASRVSAGIVCPGANNPVTPEAERLLEARGVLSVPDFVANCGGVLGGTMEFASIGADRIAAFIDSEVGDRITAVFNKAEGERRPVRAIAESIAFEKFERVKLQADRPTLSGRLLGIGLEFYRRGWIPGPLVGALSPGYFVKALG